jgi:glucose dehydrogenase
MNGYSRRIRIALLVSLLLLPAVAAVWSQSNNGPQSDDLPAAAGKEWPAVGGDRGGTHYSTLSQINKENVKNLGGAWMSKEFDDGASSRATPVINDGLMFLTAGTRIFALNAKTGEIRWRYRADSHPLPGNGNIIAVQTSGFSVPDNEGLTTGGGSVFVGLMDGHMVAIGQKTGEVEWSQQIGGPPPKKEGTQVSDPPIYWRGVLYVGMSADYGLRGRVFAIDAKTGKEMWHWYDIPGPGEVGHDTWPQNSDVWTRGGGGIWLPGTIDPDLGLIYYGTGNAVPQFGGEARPGNNLFTSSVVA